MFLVGIGFREDHWKCMQFGNLHLVFKMSCVPFDLVNTFLGMYVKEVTPKIRKKLCETY